MYINIKNSKDEEFRRLTGLKRSTFDKMIAILQEANLTKRRKGGRKSKLSIEDQLLMTMEYLREYRTYFHIAKNYGVTESCAYKKIKWVENILSEHRDFQLPERKELQKSNIEFEVIIVDATETPIERPKKNQKEFYSGKKKTYI